MQGRTIDLLFQPAPPCEGATWRVQGRTIDLLFQPAPPCEGATRCGTRSTGSAPRFQPAPPCEGATIGDRDRDGRDPVSTRAPVRGGDHPECCPRRSCRCFNPRPRARGRRAVLRPLVGYCLFQPAPPCEGATTDDTGDDQNWTVSTRAPVRGGDPRRRAWCSCRKRFQPAPPCEGATQAPDRPQRHAAVSTRAPVRGGDSQLSRQPRSRVVSTRAPVRGGDELWARGQSILEAGFNPRPRARGRRALGAGPVDIGSGFQPAPPCEGATLAITNVSLFTLVSTRAPVRGGDSQLSRQPRSRVVSTRAPVRGGDELWARGQSILEAGFNPRPRARGRRGCGRRGHSGGLVSTRAPVRGGDPVTVSDC